MREAPEPTVLLEWYDRHARVMPWRIGPTERQAGHAPDPYRIWLSEVMLQQTTVAAVKSYFVAFTERWPTVVDLAAADDADVMAAWAGLGYYARARNLLKCARVVTSEYGGAFPATRDALLALPGIGPYTASAIAAIAFDEPATVVDGNVERVMSRIFAVQTPLPKSKPELTQFAQKITPIERPGDYAQAIMDLGATICTPKSPACGLCPWMEACQARKSGIQHELPRKAPKRAKPVRFGTAYVVRRDDGAWLLETREETGLLGGMLGWPSTPWVENTPVDTPPLEAEWQKLEPEVRHTFTHFHLRLQVLFASAPEDAKPLLGTFLLQEEFSPSDLPTVMRKVFDVASQACGSVEEPTDTGI